MKSSSHPLVITGAGIYCSETGSATQGQNLLLQDGIISHIGQFSTCIDKAISTPEIVSLKGQILLPGFVDTHMHVVELAKKKLMPDISNCHTIHQIKQSLGAFADKHRDYQGWILGGVWDLGKLDEPEALNKELLDAIFGDRPVALWSRDYHVRLCNSAALKIMGISVDSPDPSGGKLARNSRGELTGMLYEEASLIPERFIEPPSRTVLLDALRATISDLNQMGITGVHTMEWRDAWSIISDLAPKLQSCRFTRHFPLKELDEVEKERADGGVYNEWLALGGMKLFADGALGSQTAACFDPYPGSTNRGILRMTDQDIYQQALAATAKGFPVLTHAIGDRAVHQVLSTYKRLNQSYPNPGHRIEHIQSIRPSDLPLLTESQAYCAIQPVHLASDIPYLESYWPDTKGQAFALRDIVSHCRDYGFGSDAPIDDPNPFHGIYTALMRKEALNPANLSWMPDQTLTLSQAIHGYTLGAAAIAGRQNQYGAIKAHYMADLLAIEAEALINPEFWLNAQPTALFVAGRQIL